MSSCFFMSTSPLLPEVYIIILSHVTTLFAYFASSGAEKWFLDRSIRIVLDRSRRASERERRASLRGQSTGDRRGVAGRPVEDGGAGVRYWNCRTASRSRSVRMNSVRRRVAWHAEQLKLDRRS